MLLKKYIAGILAIVTDFIMFTLLFLSIPLFIIQSNLQEFIKPVTTIPVEILISLLLIISFALTGSYTSSKVNIGKLSIKRPVWTMWVLSLIIIVFLMYQPPSATNSSSYLLKIIIIAAIFSSFIILSRMAIPIYIAYLLRSNILTHRVLFSFHHSIKNPYLKEFIRRINTNNHTLVGYCSNKSTASEFMEEVPHLGKFIETPKICAEQNIDEVIIFNHHHSINETEQILANLDTQRVVARITPEGKEYIINQQQQRAPDEIPTISIQPKKRSLGYKATKRLLDIFVSIFGLLFTALVYPYISYRIKKSSDGPVLYKQQRMNNKGKPFKLYKFRTMYVDAEKDVPLLASKGKDPRITNFGNFLRRAHLDELPQFWNVLKGEMSLVGIRPERDYFIKQLNKETPYYKFIGKIKPGLTSLGIVKYGYAHNIEEMKERMFYDIIYLNNQSLIFDIKIIGQTIIYIFSKMLFKSK